MVSIGLLGAGRMGEALIKGLLAGRSGNELSFIETDSDRATYISQSYDAKRLHHLKELSHCDVCIIAIKPQNVSRVIEELSKSLSPSVLIVSIVAGMGLGYFTQHFPNHRLARVMPNTAALIREGISGISFSAQCTQADRDMVVKIFKSLGEVSTLPDSLMNAVTALSGSGPAYYYLLTHYYAKIAEEYGMDYSLALSMMTQTMLGAAKMMQVTQLNPEELIRMVASPGGTTEAALKVLREPALFEILSVSYRRAHDRARELDPSS